MALVPPAGTPLAGYGNPARRLLFPDVFGRYPYAFWFKPSEGTLDPLFTRALVLEQGRERVAWVTVELVAVDRSFTREVRERLRAAGLRPVTLIVSASHTHSGPGAFVPSALWAFIALDRFQDEVRSALVAAVVRAISLAESARAPARVATFSRQAPEVTVGRLGLPVDPEIVGLKFATASGRPIGLVWNYAIHGTMLGALNLRLSGDVMGVASQALERDLGVPVLFVNGAVGDVSPRRRGLTEMVAVGNELAATVVAGWTQAADSADAAITTRGVRVLLPAPVLSLRNCLGRLLPQSLTIPLGSVLGRDAELTAVSVGETVWVTIPGELQSALGDQIKAEARRSFARGFVAGVSNDYLGYFVTATAYPRTSYVTCNTVYGPAAGDLLTRAARRLIGELAEARGGTRR
ncbi:MAG: neutral/alkaline non-lysosomal ceramidase N-terminal domain-containing protein [Candidatus Rokuibacteriota bacterium]